MKLSVMQMSSIADNIKKITDSLPSNVKLVAVSKTRTAEEIMEAYNYGHRDFGENKAQELCDKYEALPKDIRWHYIGHLQSNKVKYLVGKVELIHSVDSKKLADEVNKYAARLGLKQNILVQVNVAGEVQKSGISYNEAEELCMYIIDNCKNINLMGLMEVAPDLENREEVRPYFAKLSQLGSKLNLEILSMGMTQDYEIAIEEGANIVRLGSAIFGQRVYKQNEV